MHSSFIAATLLFAAFDFFPAVNALALPLRRSTIESRQSAASGTTVNLAPLNKTEGYVTDITINGQSFTVQIDTGSADLWVRASSPIPGAFDSTASTTVSYVDGTSFTGADKFATVTLGGFNITNQVYMEVPPSSDSQDLSGLMGLGPSNNSNIFETADKDGRANSTLVSLFAQNAAAEPFFTYKLGRLEEVLDLSPGTLTFAEAIPTLSNITSQPKLPVVITPSDGQFKQWAVSMDGMIVNGKNVTLPPSIVDPNNPNQFVTVLDTGSVAAHVPEEVYEAIYEDLRSLPGATETDEGLELFPCNAEVNVTFIFGGQEFPVHPLDILDSPIDGDSVCAPRFRQADADDEQDAALGDAFLRSVYALHHFGDTIRGGPAQPYIQLLSTVDVAQAHEQFIEARGDPEASSTLL